VVPGFNDLLSGVSPISITAIDPNLRTPYVQQFNLTLQQEFGRNFLLEIGYVGSKGTDLPRQVRINQARLASPADPVNGIIENTPLNALFRVPFLGFSPTGLVQIQSSGNSTYHSLQASLTKRYSHGFQFLASYTYSKAIDDSSTNGPDGDASPVATGNQQALFLNRGLSDFDRTQRFVLSFTYDLPRAHNASNPLAKLLSGWEVAGIATVQSGTPLDITDSAGALLFGVTTSRANFTLEGSAAAAEGQGSVNSRLNRFFDTGAFAPAGLSFGNVGRNILRGPNQRNLDLSLIKKTSINEHQNIEFRAEFFNIFNTVNFANPGTNIASPLTFGIITSTSSSPRIIQFALKYSF
ncbi:MAG: TonB-dependent receptor plug, partial [Acidobacteriota bacterium]